MRRTGSMQATALILYRSYSFSIVVMPIIIRIQYCVATSRFVVHWYPKLYFLKYVGLDAKYTPFALLESTHAAHVHIIRYNIIQSLGTVFLHNYGTNDYFTGRVDQRAACD